MSLRFFGDELDPEEITARLGKQPTAGVRKGRTWITELGGQKTARTGSWRLQAGDCRPGDLDRQINDLLEGLSEDLAVWADLSTRFKADIFCGIFMQEENEGISLSAKSMRELSSRGLLFDIDVYCPERSE